MDLMEAPERLMKEARRVSHPLDAPRGLRFQVHGKIISRTARVNFGDLAGRI